MMHSAMLMRFCFFFFQAEDGIRDHCVTGVQTCALPISRADDLQAEPLDRLEGFSPGDERGQDEVAERPVFEQQLAYHVAVDGDVAQRLRDHRRDEDRLSREQVELAEESRR